MNRYPTGVDGTVARYRIDESQPDAVTIVRELQGMAEQYGRDPQMRSYALDILPRWIPANGTGQKIAFLTQWVKSHVKYVPDPDGTELIIGPFRMLGEINASGLSHGDCDDHVLLLASLLRSIGIDSRVVATKINGSALFNHVILEVDNGRGSWVDVDPVAKAGFVGDYTERLPAY